MVYFLIEKFLVMLTSSPNPTFLKTSSSFLNIWSHLCLSGSESNMFLYPLHVKILQFFKGGILNQKSKMRGILTKWLVYLKVTTCVDMYFGGSNIAVSLQACQQTDNKRCESFFLPAPDVQLLIFPGDSLLFVLKFQKKKKNR